MDCPRCAQPIPEGARFCQHCGTPLPASPAASAASPVPSPPRPQDDFAERLIPYRNPYALTAYYVGVFSLIPCLGFILAIVAIVLGSLGLRAARENPSRHGVSHAWAGIILGIVSILGHIVGVALLMLV